MPAEPALLRRVVTWPKFGGPFFMPYPPPVDEKYLGYLDEDNRLHYAPGITEADKDFYIHAVLTRAVL